MHGEMVEWPSATIPRLLYLMKFDLSVVMAASCSARIRS